MNCIKCKKRPKAEGSDLCGFCQIEKTKSVEEKGKGKSEILLKMKEYLEKEGKITEKLPTHKSMPKTRNKEPEKTRMEINDEEMILETGNKKTIMKISNYETPEKGIKKKGTLKYDTDTKYSTYSGGGVRVGSYRMGLNRRVNAMSTMMQIVFLFIWLQVGGTIINVVTSALGPDPSASAFYSSYRMLGLSNPSGLIGIVTILISVMILINIIQITRY